VKWLAHFQRFSAKQQEGVYRLLLLDGFGSHCTKEFLDYYDRHKIIVFCLSPHSSHLLQPLDLVVFQPYKHYHAEAVEKATRTGCGDFNKSEFLDTIDTICQQTFKPSTLRSGFRAAGLIPYNPEIVISKVREATLPPSQAVLTSGPSESPSGIPLTISTLKAMGEELQLEAKELSPSLQHKLKLVLQGGLTLAQSGALAMDHMEHTRAAEEVRNARHRAQRRRQLQKGGVLYASEARIMGKRREDAEVDKAEQQLRKAQNARKRALQAERKPFLDEIKTKGKEVNARLEGKEKAQAKADAKARATLQAYRKKVSRIIVKAIKQHVQVILQD